MSKKAAIKRGHGWQPDVPDNAIGAAIQFNRLKQKLKLDFVPSRLFIQYKAVQYQRVPQVLNQIQSGR